MTAGEELIERGRQDGLNDGLKKGREDGLKKGREESLLKLLRARFGALPEAAVARIQAADSARLDGWLDRVLTATSLEGVLDGV